MNPQLTLAPRTLWAILAGPPFSVATNWASLPGLVALLCGQAGESNQEEGRARSYHPVP